MFETSIYPISEYEHIVQIERKSGETDRLHVKTELHPLGLSIKIGREGEAISFAFSVPHDAVFIHSDIWKEITYQMSLHRDEAMIDTDA